MALSNLEVVRRMLEGFDGRDPENLIAWACEDIELRTAIIGGAENNVYRGHEGVRDWARERDEMFDDIEFRVGDMIEGPEHPRGADRDAPRVHGPRAGVGCRAGGTNVERPRLSGASP